MSYRGVKEYVGTGNDKGKKVLVVDTKEADWKGTKHEDLNRYEKRKFENRLVITNAKEKVRIIYR